MHLQSHFSVSLPVFCTPSFPCNPETFNFQSFSDIQFPALPYFSCATHSSHAYYHSNFSTNSGPHFLSSAIQNTRININVMYLISAAFSRASKHPCTRIMFTRRMHPCTRFFTNHTLRLVCEVRREKEVRNGVLDVIYVSTVLAHHFPLGYLRFYQ